MQEEAKVYEHPPPMGLQRESRDEMLVRLNFERQVANNVAEIRKVTAKTVLSVIGIVVLVSFALVAIAGALRLAMDLLTKAA